MVREGCIGILVEYRSVEQNTKHRSKSTHIWWLLFDERSKVIYQEMKITVGYLYGKNNFGLCLTVDTKINLRWTSALDITSKPLQLLKENTGEYLNEFGIGKYFRWDTKKTLAIKLKTHKLDFIKSKNFWPSTPLWK